MSCSVVIVAAGSGSRMNTDTNKQYIKIAGKPVLVRTLERFNSLLDISEIILVVNINDIEYCKKNIVDINSLNKVTTIVAGGSTRQKSVYNGVTATSKDSDIIVIHDGARPFVSQKTILDSIDIARTFGSACAGTPVKDTIKVVDAKGIIRETPDREMIWAVQTPQTFKRDIIINAHNKAIKEEYIGTDDAMLVEQLGREVKIFMSDYSNIKITTQDDLILAEYIANKQSEGQGC